MAKKEIKMKEKNAAPGQSKSKGKATAAEIVAHITAGDEVVIDWEEFEGDDTYMINMAVGCIDVHSLEKNLGNITHSKDPNNYGAKFINWMARGAEIKLNDKLKAEI